MLPEVRPVEEVPGPAGAGPVAGGLEFAAFVAARGAALQRFAHLVTGGSPDVADLVQEALLRAYPRWHRLVMAGTAEAYVRRSIVNASVSRWRKDRRLVPLEQGGAVAAVAVPDPGGAVVDADLAWELVRTLGATQRAAVVLRFYEDMSYEQIAAILGCAEGTARSHIHRALTSLRGRLTEGGNHE